MITWPTPPTLIPSVAHGTGEGQGTGSSGVQVPCARATEAQLSVRSTAIAAHHDVISKDFGMSILLCPTQLISVSIQSREPLRSLKFGSYAGALGCERSEEHTSELQSLAYLVCRLLLEKKKKY